MKTPLLEIRTLIPLVQTLQLSGLSDEEPRKRVLAILDQLETTARRDSARSLVSDFRSKMVALI